MLLGSLAKLNYLDYDTSSRTYRPTLRVMLLGAWMHEEVFHGGDLLSAMERIRRRTGLTVLIGVRQSFDLRYILVIRGAKTRAPIPMPVGFTVPLLRSSSGRVLVSQMADDAIQRLVRHFNAASSDEARVKLSEVMRDVSECRKTGWVENFHYPAIGLGSFATSLPYVDHQPPMTLTVAGETSYLEAHRQQVREEVGAALRIIECA